MIPLRIKGLVSLLLAYYLSSASAIWRPRDTATPRTDTHDNTRHGPGGAHICTHIYTLQPVLNRKWLFYVSRVLTLI